ncbi:thioredoxin family protein [Aliiroseovarius sp. F47248L]|uniref:thioredoxin family protein n=1 Tax=Aliiroseovarius sp. F47248L TaxID=2926420 RepID=UPI001FF5F8EC|nr:thioredoxin family protein [Aliiroseovarius sp. F47248L]MCK0140036.1 thioredoxin family protein [Aliiroseovarius sp. F47248L]
MKRRQFLTLTAAASFAPWAAQATADYSPGLVTKALDKGETVFLDFKASWCSTCAAQERVINALKAENPAYESSITFIDVDWDLHRKSKLTKSLRIPRRSTLVVLKGDQELGRIVAGTSKSDIKALMDTALTAATT